MGTRTSAAERLIGDGAAALPDSWYRASADVPDLRPALDGDARVDVCIVGAGYTGLSAARTLAAKGLSVLVLEARRAGFGASGRNGGQVHSGLNLGPRALIRRVGAEDARKVWDLVEDGKRVLRDTVEAHAPEARYRPGVAEGLYSEAEGREAQADLETAREVFGYDQVEYLEPQRFREIVRSPSYSGGTLDHGAGHIHPLRYAFALARLAEDAGARICEGTPVTRLLPGAPARLETPCGIVTADHVLLAGNGYLARDIAPAVSARVMPIRSFIGATAPLGPEASEVLSRDIAVADSKWVVNYYRLSEDGRMLFGGRASHLLSDDGGMGRDLHKRMTALFPQLAGARFDHVWGGTLGITMPRLPAMQRVAPNILSAAGYSGHGVAIAGHAGRLMGEAIAGEASGFDTLARLKVADFPGGATLRRPLLALALTWYGLRDRLGL